MFAAAAVLTPLFANGTEAGDAAWAGCIFFGLNALFAANRELIVRME